MTDKNFDIEQMIDQAISKDLAKIPQISLEPDPSLLSQVKAMQPIVKNMGTSFLSGRLFKFTFLVVGAGAMIFAWYMLTRSSQPESFRSESKQFVLSPLDSVKKKQNDSIVKEMQKQTGVLRQSGTNAVNLGTEKPDSSATQDVKERHSEDLLPADKKVKKAHGIKMPIDQQH